MQTHSHLRFYAKFAMLPRERGGSFMRVRAFFVVGMLTGIGLLIGCNPATEPLPPGAAREFVLVLKEMRFIGESPLAIAGVENPDIVVQVGDRVKITLKNKEDQLILHDFAISNHDVKLYGRIHGT